jgi:hypothetical protein
LRATRQSIGAAVGLLVEAHGRSTQAGTKKLLEELGAAARGEMELSAAQARALDEILARMNDGLGEIIARHYDPVFEEHVRASLSRSARKTLRGEAR